MNSHLLSALDAEESTNGKGFTSAINYGDDVISSDKDEDDDEDEVIIVDKDKSGYSLRTTGPPRPQPPLSRQHKDAQDFSSKDIGRIPKISSPKTSLTLPKTKNNTAKTFQSYKPSNSELGNRQKSQKRSWNDNNSEKNSPGKSPEFQQPTITLYKTSTVQSEPIIIAAVNSAVNIENRPLVQGVLQIATTAGQNNTKTFRIIPHSQLMKETSSTATEVVDLSGTPHTKNALPTQMTPAPGKCQKLEVISRLKKLKTSPSSSSATEDSKTEIDDDDDDDDDEKVFIHCALCANCGVKSKNLNICDHCKCDFSKKKYRKLIPIPKDNASERKNNVPLTTGSFPIKNFYANKSNTILLPVKKQLPPSTSKSDNWKEKPRLKTYSQRKTKKPVQQPVCISISSDEDEKPMSQDEGARNGLDTDSSSRSPTFKRATPQQRSNGRVQQDSVFTDDENSELSNCSHHRTNVGGSNVSKPRVSRKQKMRDQDEQLLSDQKEKGKAAKLKEDDLSDCSLDNEDITLQDGLRCVSVEATHLRIGSQEFKSRTCVEFQWNQIVLHLRGNPSRLELKTAELTSCIFCLSSSLFTIFLKTVPAAGVCIRDRLHMDNHSRYDPGSNNESKKTINLTTNKMTENDKVRLRKLLESYKEINQDLKIQEVDCARRDVLWETCTPTTQTNDKSEQDTMDAAFTSDEVTSTTIAHDQLLLQSLTTKLTTVKPIVQLIYPPNETKGRISVTNEDVSCLEEGEFINDVIIDFYLKYLLHEVLGEEDQVRTHIFSSFFYKRLSRRVASTSKFEGGPQRSVAERRHSHVKSWTRNIDLFEKDFIVIPVNESAHWYVAIVCFPGLQKPGANNNDLPASNQQGILLNQDSEKTENAISKNPTSISSDKLTNQEQSDVTCESDSIPCGETMEVEEPDSSDSFKLATQINDTVTNSESEGGHDKSESDQITTQNGVTCSDNIQETIRQNKEIDATNSLFHTHQSFSYKQPCILIFDSLKGTSKRTACINKLKEYISVEWKIKKGYRREFELKGMQPEVPQQTNYHDCGVYVLQYVESFFTMPIKNFGTPLRGLAQWFNEERVSCKREDIKALISYLAQNQKAKR